MSGPASLAWVVVAEGTTCAIGATYGGNPRISLSLIASDKQADTVFAAIKGDGWSIIEGGRYPTTLLFDDASADTIANGMVSKENDKSAGIVVPISASSVSAFATAKSLGITVKGVEITRLSLAGSAKAVAALQACMVKLPAWVEAHRQAEALARQRLADPFAAIRPDMPVADPDPRQWISSDDYPAIALINGEQGTVGFRYSVNAQGRIENCVISQSSGSPSLDRATCSVLTSRGRYQPGKRDISGSIKWTLPQK